MIDLDEIERIANAGDAYGYVTTCATVLALIAEVRALREDAARYQWLRDKARMTDYDGGNYGVWDIRGIDAYSNWIKAPYNHKTFEGAVDFARGAK